VIAFDLIHRVAWICGRCAADRRLRQRLHRANNALVVQLSQQALAS